MAIQMCESWESPVESFINYYKGNRLSLEMVLFLLETLPEETSNNRLILVPEHQAKITTKLKAEYAKVAEFLSLVRSNLAQLTSALGTNGTNAPANSNALNYKMLGKILKVWHNWKPFDTLSSNGDLSRSFWNDCLEIVRNPRLREEGLEEETYEISVDCIVDSLQECAYLRDKKAYGHSHEEHEYDHDHEYEKSEGAREKRYSELVELQKACFNVLVHQMQPHLEEAFEKRDVALYVNLSMLFVNLVDSVNIEHSTSDAEVVRLMEYLLKLIALPYLLMYSGSAASKFANPFTSEYSHVKCREAVLTFLEDLGKEPGRSERTLTGSNPEGTNPMDLDDEVCYISQKAVYALVDVLSKFSKSLGRTLSGVQSVSELATVTPGLFAYLASNILELLLLVSLPPYRQYVYSDTSRNQRMNYTEHIDNYSYYLADVKKAYEELLSMVGRNAVFEYVSTNLVNSPTLAYSVLRVQSSFELLPPCISITATNNGSARSGVVVCRTASVQAAEKVLSKVTELLMAHKASIYPEKVHDNILLLMAKVDAVRFVGNVREIFSVPETRDLLPSLFRMLRQQMRPETVRINAPEDPRSAIQEDVQDLCERLKYESGYSISMICDRVKMERLQNNEELLTIVLETLKDADNEMMVLMLESLATSCSTLNERDLMAVFSELTSSTLAQLTSIVNAVPANTAIPSSSISKTDRELIVKLLNSIVAFTRNLRNRPELEPVVGERILPVLLSLLRIFYLDEELVEVICRCIKHNARVLDLQFAKYVAGLAQTISAVAQAKMVSTYLYLIEWLHSIFYAAEVSGAEGQKGCLGSHSNQCSLGNLGSLGSQGSYSREKAEIMNLYGLLTRLTLSVFKSSYHNYPSHGGLNSSRASNIGAGDGSSAGATSENEQDDGHEEMLVEDFYGLQAEFFLNSDTYLNDLATINEIIDCSCKFIFIRRPRCVFNFWKSLLKMSRRNQQVAALAGRHLQTLVSNCLRTLQEACSKSTEFYVEDLMTAVLAFVRSSHFALPSAVGGPNGLSQGGASGDAAAREQYLEVLLANGLNCLPAEIIGNERLRQSFLSGLLKRTASTVHHLYKLLSKLSMRNRM
nr:hypothetical protein MACL_00001393 [Theileria orientalis]